MTIWCHQITVSSDIQNISVHKIRVIINGLKLVYSLVDLILHMLPMTLQVIVVFIMMIAFQSLHNAGIEQGHDNVIGGLPTLDTGNEIGN